MSHHRCWAYFTDKQQYLIFFGDGFDLSFYLYRIYSYAWFKTIRFFSFLPLFELQSAQATCMLVNKADPAAEICTVQAHCLKDSSLSHSSSHMQAHFKPLTLKSDPQSAFFSGSLPPHPSGWPASAATTYSPRNVCCDREVAQSSSFLSTKGINVQGLLRLARALHV